ncbi:MAG TPA: VOC family protein [Oculatellaceae cyanobacterium]|jgi:predicted enzyme related to lactoylglutathione lyase
MSQTTIRVQEVAFTVYPVQDMVRARRFYESVLNLTPAMASDNGIWVEYDVKGAAFCLMNLEGQVPVANGPSIAFEVDDLEQTIAQLREAGVPFLMENIESPVCRMAVVQDTEGNAIIIHKRKY